MGKEREDRGRKKRTDLKKKKKTTLCSEVHKGHFYSQTSGPCSFPVPTRKGWPDSVGMPMKRVSTCTGNEKKYISPGNDWLHWLVNSSEETYIKLPFPHNVPFRKKSKWKSWKSLRDHLSSSYHLAKKPAIVIEFVLLLFNCCTFIKKLCCIIRGLVLLEASP